MFCVLIKNNEIAHFITSANWLGILLIGGNAFLWTLRTTLLKQLPINFRCIYSIVFNLLHYILLAPSYSLPRFCLLHNWVNRLALVFCSIAHPNWFTFCSFARHFQCGYFMWIVFSVIARAHTHTHTRKPIRSHSYRAIDNTISLHMLHLFCICRLLQFIRVCIIIPYHTDLINLFCAYGFCMCSAFSQENHKHREHCRCSNG